MAYTNNAYPEAVIVIHPGGFEIREAAQMVGGGKFRLKHHDPIQFRRGELVDGEWTVRVEPKP